MSFILLLLLQLLLLSSGNLLLGMAAPVDNFCGKTKNPGRCVAILTGTDERTPRAGPELLEYIAIKAGQGTGGNARIVVARLASSPSKDPEHRIIYTNCENSYLDALDALNLAHQNLKNRRYDKLVETSQIVGRVGPGCAQALYINSSLKGANDDTLVLGEVIGLIAKAL